MTLALLVDFKIQAQKANEFAEAIASNAATSLEKEAGCQRFDVCRSPQDPGHFFLYELYDDQAAINAHLAAEHFLHFDALTKPWVMDKQARVFRLGAA